MLDLYSKSNYNESTLPRRFYNAMHSTVDLVVDSVVNTLKHTGLYENTIIVLSADSMCILLGLLLPFVVLFYCYIVDVQIAMLQSVFVLYLFHLLL